MTITIQEHKSSKTICSRCQKGQNGTYNCAFLAEIHKHYKRARAPVVDLFADSARRFFYFYGTKSEFFSDSLTYCRVSHTSVYLLITWWQCVCKRVRERCTLCQCVTVCTEAPVPPTDVNVSLADSPYTLHVLWKVLIINARGSEGSIVFSIFTKFFFVSEWTQ